MDPQVHFQGAPIQGVAAKSYATAAVIHEKLKTIPEQGDFPKSNLKKGFFKTILNKIFKKNPREIPSTVAEDRPSVQVLPKPARPIPQPKPVGPPPAPPSGIVQNKPINVSLIVADRQIRPATFNKEGQEIKEEAPARYRIQLNGVPGEQFQLALQGAPVELAPGQEAAVGLHDGVATMLVEANGRRYLVDIKLSEISDRLLISKDLEQAAREGKLDLLFQRKQVKLQYLPRMVADYQKLFDAHFKSNPTARVGQFVLKDRNVASEGLNARQMMKVLRVYHRQELFIDPTAEGVYLPFTDLKNKYNIKDLSIIFRRELGQLKMSRVDVQETLGEGSFGTAIRIAQLDLNKVLVAKVLKKFDTSEQLTEARQDLLNEFTLLREIHSRGKVKGIQDSPHLFIAIGNARFYAMVGTAYEGNTWDLIRSDAFKNQDLATKLDCCSQVLEGGARLAALGIVHSDQKPENILFLVIEENGKKRYRVEMADLGGARKAKNGLSGIPVHTARYTPVGDLKTGADAKTDVYQRGAILFNFLTGGKDPWPLLSSGYPDHSDRSKFNEQALIDNGVPPPLRKLIREMCDPKPKKRPKALEAYQRWTARVPAGTT